MPASREIRLRPWEEAVGVYEGMEISEFEVGIILKGEGDLLRITFPTDGPEVEVLRKELHSCKAGARIALLGTDDASRPLLVRMVGQKMFLEKDDPEGGNPQEEPPRSQPTGQQPHGKPQKSHVRLRPDKNSPKENERFSGDQGNQTNRFCNPFSVNCS